MAATRNDWKTTPLPVARALISVDRTYSSSEFQRIKEGTIPEEMEDKWFVFYEEPLLYFHRSWTGFCIYHVRFELTEEFSQVAEVLVSRDPEQYGETNNGRDALLLSVLLDRLAGRSTEEAWNLYVASSRGNS